MPEKVIMAEGCEFMSSLKNGFYFAGVILLLICIGVIVWYALIHSQRPEMEQNGTLAFRRMEMTQICESERPVCL